MTGLSGWCSTPHGKPDQDHDRCKSPTCECPGDPATHGRAVDKQGRIGRADMVRQHPAGSDHPSLPKNERG